MKRTTATFLIVIALVAFLAGCISRINDETYAILRINIFTTHHGYVDDPNIPSGPNNPFAGMNPQNVTRGKEITIIDTDGNEGSIRIQNITDDYVVIRVIAGGMNLSFPDAVGTFRGNTFNVYYDSRFTISSGPAEPYPGYTRRGWILSFTSAREENTASPYPADNQNDIIQINPEDIISIRYSGFSSWIKSDCQIHTWVSTIYNDERLVRATHSDRESIVEEGHSTNENAFADLVEALNYYNFFNLPDDMSEEAEDGGGSVIIVETENYTFQKGGANVSNRQYLNVARAIHNVFRYWRSIENAE